MASSHRNSFFSVGEEAKEAKEKSVSAVLDLDAVPAPTVNPEILTEMRRISPALSWQSKPIEFSEEKLDVKMLETIASKTNSALIHYSGNCLLLAYVMFYNLKMRRIELTVGNTSPWYQGCNGIVVSQMILGKILLPFVLNQKAPITEITQRILETFKETEERYYIVSIDVPVFLDKLIGHSFNAVVLGKDENAHVVYVDAWRTSKKVQSVKQLAEKLPGKISYSLYMHKDPVKKLQKESVCMTEVEAKEAPQIKARMLL